MQFTRRIQASVSDPLRRLYLSFGFLVLFLFVGIIGYMLIEGWSPMKSLYMTLITVTTVGYGDVVPSNNTSRIFTVFLLFLGIGAATTAVSNTLQLIVGQHLYGAVRMRRIEEAIKLLEDHYIVAGYGRIGQQIVRDTLARGEQCLVIDSGEDVQHSEFLLEENIPFITADATEDATLERAGVRRAKGFVAALPSDADNVLAILTARGLSESIFIVARSSRVSAESKLRRAGANHVISPYQVGGHRMAIALLRPAVHDFMNHLSDVSDAESYDIGQIDVKEASYLVGQTMATCDLRRVRGLTILAIVDADHQLTINPKLDRKFTPGDRLVVIGPPKSIYNLEEIYETSADDTE